MTRDAVIAEMEKTVKNAVTRNRIQAILGACKTVEEFSGLSNAEVLAKYRQTDSGKRATCDLGHITYEAVKHVQAVVCERVRAEKTAERDAKKAELWFTRDEMMVIAAFMDSFKIEKIELGQVKRILASVVKGDKHDESAQNKEESNVK